MDINLFSSFLTHSDSKIRSWYNLLSFFDDLVGFSVIFSLLIQIY
jgi:hypothetical protein